MRVRPLPALPPSEFCSSQLSRRRSHCQRILIVGRQADGRVMVPTGRALTPAGSHIEVNDRPLGMVLSPDGALLAVVTGSNFNPRALHLIDAATRSLKQTIAIGNSFVGVGFSPAGDRIYVGGGAGNDVRFFRKQPDGSFAAEGTLAIAGAAPSGLAVSENGSRLYVALNMTHQPAVIDTTTRAIWRASVASIPTTVLSADGRKRTWATGAARCPARAM